MAEVCRIERVVDPHRSSVVLVLDSEDRPPFLWSPAPPDQTRFRAVSGLSVCSVKLARVPDALAPSLPLLCALLCCPPIVLERGKSGRRRCWLVSRKGLLAGAPPDGVVDEPQRPRCATPFAKIVEFPVGVEGVICRGRWPEARPTRSNDSRIGSENRRVTMWLRYTAKACAVMAMARRVLESRKRPSTPACA